MERKRSPFPGMDPYLESGAIFPGLHDALVTYVRDQLAPQLPPRYYADLRDRLFVEVPSDTIIPDVSIVETESAEAARAAPAARDADTSLSVIVELKPVQVREPYIEIRDAKTGNRIITIIEVLSPTNKEEGTAGHREYLDKQREVLDSDTNLVEIDLLRGGKHTVSVPAGLLARYRPFHYLVVVRRSARAAQREVYPIRLSSRLPAVRVPLLPEDREPTVHLQECMDRAYEMGAYTRRVNYATPADPPLLEQDAAWARELTAKTS